MIDITKLDEPRTKIEISTTRTVLTVSLDGRTLIEVARGDEVSLERIADILAEKRFFAQARQVRSILYGR